MASSFLFHKGLNGREYEVGLPTINNSTTRDSLNPVGSDVCNVVTRIFLRFRKVHPPIIPDAKQKRPGGFRPDTQL